MGFSSVISALYWPSVFYLVLSLTVGVLIITVRAAEEFEIPICVHFPAKKRFWVQPCRFKKSKQAKTVAITIPKDQVFIIFCQAEF
jgi:hypothetical protein